MYLEYTGTPNLIVLHIHHISHKLKVWGNTVSRKFITTIFLTAPAHFMSMCHILKNIYLADLGLSCGTRDLLLQ